MLNLLIHFAHDNRTLLGTVIVSLTSQLSVGRHFAEALVASPGDFGKFIASETQKWAKVIRAANIKVY